MKLKTAALYLILCMTLVISGCGGSSDSKSTGGKSANTEKTDKQSPSKFQKISDYADAWTTLYSQNEAAINNNDDVIMELVTPATEFISGVQYDLLNMENRDGRFEGELMMAGFPGFLDRSGSKMSFGYDYIREENGFAPSMKAGDRIVEDGKCDLAKGWYQTEKFTERNGQKIDRSYSEFKRIKTGEMIYLGTTSYRLNSRQEADLSNTCTYVKAGKDKYDFVIGKAAKGPAFEKLTFIDKDDLSKDEARQMMEAAGYKIDKSGGIAGGTLVVD